MRGVGLRLLPVDRLLWAISEGFGCFSLRESLQALIGTGLQSRNGGLASQPERRTHYPAC